MTDQEFDLLWTDGDYNGMYAYVKYLESEVALMLFALRTLRQMSKDGANVETLLAMVNFLNRIELTEERDDASTTD